MLTAVLALIGALVYGTADFFGGVAAKRISAVTTTAITSSAGLVALLAVLPFTGGVWNPADLGWGVLGGFVSAAAISLLYACLAIGPMSILSPLTAVVSAVTPMLWGLAVKGEQFGAIGYWALGLALVAVVLVGFVPEKGAVRPSPRGILMGVGAGAAIGAFLIVMDQTTHASGLTPLVASRTVSAAVMFAVVGVIAVATRRRGAAGAEGAGRAPSSSDERVSEGDLRERGSLRAGVLLAASAGIADATANALLIAAMRSGDLSIAAVLGAMYPAGTILLAAVVLRERIAPVQWVGLVLALAAAAMLAVA